MAQPDIGVAMLPADFSRWEDLLDLVRRSFAYMDGVVDPPSSARRLTTESLRAKACEETCFIASHEGRIVGCAFIAEHADRFYVGKLAVAPEMQGTGVGRALMEEAEALALKAGKPMLELQTRIELTANQAAFRKLGFHEAARTAHAGYDRPTSVTMRKVLS